MSRLKFFKYAMIGLLISNTILIAALIIGRPQGGPPGASRLGGGPPPGGPDRASYNSPKTIVIEKLEMDETQTKKFEVLIDHHREAVKEASKNLFTLRKDYYSSLTDEDITRTESLDSLINAENANIENIHQIHFKDIKGILDEEQFVNYNAFLKEIPDVFFPPQRRGNR